MSQLPSVGMFRKIRRLVGPPEPDAAADGPLLDRFIAQNDEVAFETLLARHGPMVLGVCKRLLRDRHLVDDVFQATFLVLVRKASSIRRRESVGSWLHGVARHVALRARATQTRNRTLEWEADVQAPTLDNRVHQDEVHAVLDEEVHRLPEKYRAPLVLCYLEGKTNEEAARHLGCPTGTVFTRLSRGREMLRNRLVRRGVALPTALGALCCAAEEVSAAVPAALQDATIQAAAQAAAGKAAGSGLVAALVEDAVRSLGVSRWKGVSGLLLLLAAAGTLAAAVAPAARVSPKGNEAPRRLLAVGVRQHLFAETVNLGPKERDLHVLAKALSQRLQIPATQTFVMDEQGPKPAPLIKAVVERGIADYLDGSRAQDRIVLLFVGTATVVKDRAYLVPFDGELHSPDSLIELKWLYDRLAACKARQKVVILDLCRLDVNRQWRRPGGEQMSRVLDKALRSPPEGVQVWSACAEGQNSHAGEGVGGSVFLDQLYHALVGNEARQIPLGIYTADDSIPVHRLAAGVPDRPGVDLSTAREAERLYKRTQLPRLSGAETPSDLRVDVRAAAPAALTFHRAPAERPYVQGLYRATVMLDKHSLTIQSTFQGDAEVLRRQVPYIQKNLAVSQLELSEMLDDFGTIEKLRDKELPLLKLSYDYVQARLKARFAMTHEYNHALSDFRGDNLPQQVKGHTSWRLVPHQTIAAMGDAGRQARLFAKEANDAIDHLSLEGVPWKKLAQADNVLSVGLRWESVP